MSRKNRVHTLFYRSGAVTALVLTLLFSNGFVLAQGTPPPLPPATPVVVVQATPTPAPTPTGNLLQRVVTENQNAFLVAAISAIISAILVGVFLRDIASAISTGASRLFDFLFGRISYSVLVRWRYARRYRQRLAAMVQKLASAQIVDRPINLENVYVPVVLTEELRGADGSSYEAISLWQDELRRKQRARAVEQWTAITRHPRLVVMGDPGAGKTTYLFHLAYRCALGQRLTTHIPMVVRLRDLIRCERVEEALAVEFDKLGFPNALPFIQRHVLFGKRLCAVSTSLQRHGPENAAGLRIRNRCPQEEDDPVCSRSTPLYPQRKGQIQKIPIWLSRRKSTSRMGNFLAPMDEAVKPSWSSSKPHLRIPKQFRLNGISSD